MLWKQLKFVEGVSPMFETDRTISNNCTLIVMNPFIFTSERAEFVFTRYISYFSKKKFVFELSFQKSSGWAGL